MSLRKSPVSGFQRVNMRISNPVAVTRLAPQSVSLSYYRWYEYEDPADSALALQPWI